MSLTTHCLASQSGSEDSTRVREVSDEKKCGRVGMYMMTFDYGPNARGEVFLR